MTNQERSKDKTNENTTLIGYIYFLLTGSLIGYLLSRPRSVTHITPISSNTEPAPLTREEVVRRLTQARQNNSRPDFRGANLHGTDLSGLDLNHADLQGADISEANLSNTDLSFAYLRKTNATGTSFIEAKLTGSSIYAMVLDHASLPLYTFSDPKRRHQIIGDWEQAKSSGNIQDYHHARVVLLMLKNHLRDTGRTEEMIWAHQNEQRIIRTLINPFRRMRWYHQGSRGTRLLYSMRRFTFKWLISWFADITCGYGQSISRTIASFFTFQVLFTLGYWLTNSVQSCSGITVSDPLKIILFSFAALTTTSLKDLCAASPSVELMMSIQVVLGIAITGLIGFVLGNRIQYSA